jgi:8-oxo-dGTP diphosphatase
MPRPTHTDVSLWYAVGARAEEITGWDSREFAGIAWMTTGGILATRAETLGPHLKRAVRKLAALTDAPG